MELMKLMKNKGRYPKEVREVVKKINEWIKGDNHIEYNCDPVVLTHYEYPVNTTGRKTVKEYVLCSNYEDGFGALIYKKGVWYTREYMSERPDQVLTHSCPENEIIGIMAG